MHTYCHEKILTSQWLCQQYLMTDTMLTSNLQLTACYS